MEAKSYYKIGARILAFVCIIFLILIGANSKLDSANAKQEQNESFESQLQSYRSVLYKISYSNNPLLSAELKTTAKEELKKIEDLIYKLDSENHLELVEKFNASASRMSEFVEVQERSF